MPRLRLYMNSTGRTLRVALPRGGAYDQAETSNHFLSVPYSTFIERPRFACVRSPSRRLC